MELRNYSDIQFLRTMSGGLILKACIVDSVGRLVYQTKNLERPWTQQVKDRGPGIEASTHTARAESYNDVVSNSCVAHPQISSWVIGQDKVEKDLLSVLKRLFSTRKAFSPSAAHKLWLVMNLVDIRYYSIEKSSHQAGGGLAPLICVKAHITEQFGSPTASSVIEDLHGDSFGCNDVVNSSCVAHQQRSSWVIGPEKAEKDLPSVLKRLSSTSKVTIGLQLADVHQQEQVNVQHGGQQQRPTLQEVELLQQEQEEIRRAQGMPNPYVFVRNIPEIVQNILPLVGWIVFCVQWVKGKFKVHGAFRGPGGWMNVAELPQQESKTFLDHLPDVVEVLHVIMPSQNGRFDDKLFWLKRYNRHGRKMGLTPEQYFRLIIYLYMKLRTYLRDLARELAGISIRKLFAHELQNHINDIFGLQVKISGEAHERDICSKIFHELKFDVEEMLFFRDSIREFGLGVGPETSLRLERD